ITISRRSDVIQDVDMSGGPQTHKIGAQIDGLGRGFGPDGWRRNNATVNIKWAGKSDADAGRYRRSKYLTPHLMHATQQKIVNLRSGVARRRVMTRSFAREAGRNVVRRRIVIPTSQVSSSNIENETALFRLFRMHPSRAWLNGAHVFTS